MMKMDAEEKPKIILPGQADPATRRKRLFSAQDLRATTIGWEIALPLVLGPLIGFFIDRANQTGVRWTMILLGVGLIVSITAVVRYISYEFHLMNKEAENKAKEKEQDAKSAH